MKQPTSIRTLIVIANLGLACGETASGDEQASTSAATSESASGTGVTTGAPATTQGDSDGAETSTTGATQAETSATRATEAETSVATTDGGTSEAGADADSSTTSSACEDALPVLDALPDALSETGLFDDIAADAISSWVQAYAPRFELWSDGASKRRWAYLPGCSPIDTADMDAWQLPEGARLWKEFTRDGIRIETRIIARTGDGVADWLFGTYVWDGDDAYRVSDGVDDALGTPHDVPPDFLCTSCHRQGTRVLGLSAIQLAHDGPGLTLDGLVDADQLSDPPIDSISVPGDDSAQTALGYLHANCGTCHDADGVPFVDVQMHLRTSDTTVEDTATWQTAVGLPAVYYPCDGCDIIEPGAPEQSAIVLRMLERGEMSEQMPPLATEMVDEDGVAAVSAWIETLMR
jgi:hypothetical protein